MLLTILYAGMLHKPTHHEQVLPALPAFIFILPDIARSNSLLDGHRFYQTIGCESIYKVFRFLCPAGGFLFCKKVLTEIIGQFVVHVIGVVINKIKVIELPVGI